MLDKEASTTKKMAAVREIRQRVPVGRVPAAIKNEIMQKYGVNPTNIQKGLVILDKGLSEVIEAVDTGKITINFAHMLAYRFSQSATQLVRLQSKLDGTKISEDVDVVLQSMVFISIDVYQELIRVIKLIKAHCSQDFVAKTEVNRLVTLVLELINKINEDMVNKHITKMEEEKICIH